MERKKTYYSFLIKVGVCVDWVNCWKNLKTPVRQRDVAAVDDLEVLHLLLRREGLLIQNDHIHVSQSSKKRDLTADRLASPTFSKSLIVSKLGCTELIVVEPGAKVNGAYYRDELLAKHMLPATRQTAGDHSIFQQDSAPVHRARATLSTFSVAQRRTSTPQTCGRQTAQTSTPWTTRFGAWCRNECTRWRSKTWTIWSDVWLPSDRVCSRVSSTTL